jgi:hypothetical protein
MAIVVLKIAVIVLTIYRRIGFILQDGSAVLENKKIETLLK